MRPADDIDLAILRRLRTHGREAAPAIGSRVNLSPAAVRKRIERLQRLGIIKRFTVVLDRAHLTGPSVDAFVELTFAGDADVQSLVRKSLTDSRVREAAVLAGDSDALIRVRVTGLEELGHLLTLLRKELPLVRTRVLVALERHRQTHVDAWPVHHD